MSCWCCWFNLSLALRRNTCVSWFSLLITSLTLHSHSTLPTRHLCLYEGKNGHYSRCMRPSVGLIYPSELRWQRRTLSSLRTSPSARELWVHQISKTEADRNPSQGYVSAKLLQSDKITVNWDRQISKYLTATLKWVWACEFRLFRMIRIANTGQFAS